MISPLAVALAGTSPSAVGASSAAASSAKQVVRAYGDGPVRLAPGQGVDVSFTAKRGDRVMLEVVSRGPGDFACSGAHALVDGRGRRTAPLKPSSGTKVFTVRTNGRAVLSFRGECAAGIGRPWRRPRRS